MNTVEQAIESLKQGKNVVFPTETVYGLGASIYQENALKNIFSLKNRPSDNPLIVHIHSLDQVIDLARTIPKEFYLLASAFFPGPLTIILPKNKELSDLVTAGLDTVAIRMPEHPIALEILKGVDEPIAAPSANLSGKPSPTNIDHVRTDFGDRVLIVDGGDCKIGIESTVISLVDTPIIYRPGAISLEQIENVLGCSVSVVENATKPVCPGMKYRHYAPKAKVNVYASIDELLHHTPSTALVLSNETIADMNTISYSSSTIYSLFRRADKEGVEVISIFLDRETIKNKGLINRIEKASRG